MDNCKLSGTNMDFINNPVTVQRNRATERFRRRSDESETKDSSFTPERNQPFTLDQLKPRKGKTQEEIKFLEEQFSYDPQWTKRTRKYCKKHLNLSTSQIYKWGYDKKKRNRKNSCTANSE